jgi:hypothetical protein
LQRRAGLQIAPPTEIDLGPGEVGTVAFPFRWGGAPAGDVRLYVVLRASGPGGARLRAHRARPGSYRTHPAFQLFALLGGHLVWGGGTFVSVRTPGGTEATSMSPLGSRWTRGSLTGDRG